MTLAERVREVLDAGVEDGSDVFESLALELFGYQYEANEAYRAFCDARGVVPDAVESWEDIPAFPTDAFKTEIVASFPVEEAVMAQLTSGTTAASQRGRIFRDEIGRELVFAANRVMTGAYLFPDFEAGTRTRLLLLAPSPDMAPSMGMAIGMEQTRTHFGTPDSEFLLSRGGVDVKRLVAALRQAEDTGAAVTLIGATSAFVYFLKACRKRGLAFMLPHGSRIADGGGYRGRFGEITRDDYYEMAEEVLGVPRHHCVNTLGMAESATNYFDDVLRRHVCGTSDEGTERKKVPPPWTRVRAMSLDDLTPLPDGAVGLLRHWDLVNLPTVVAVQTDNLGYTTSDGGFEIVGRAKVERGKVSELPSERSVGAMGDTRVFRMLETYVNFSISFKAARSRLKPSSGARAEVEAAEASDAVPSCPVVVDEMVAATEDAEAAERVDGALEVFGQDVEVDETVGTRESREDPVE